MVRVEAEPACVLHTRPWRETSALLEVLTPGHGRVGLIHRGARRPRRGAAPVQPFQLLEIAWRGRGELPTLTRVELLEPFPDLSGLSAVCGLYVNELTVRLLPRGLSAPALFTAYCRTLQALGNAGPPDAALRAYELALLSALGYAPLLDRDAAGQRLQPHGHYRYDRERGLVAVTEAGAVPGPVVRGETALALAAGRLEAPRVRREARELLRHLIEPLLEGRPLHSRRLLRSLSVGGPSESEPVRNAKP